MPIQIYWSIGKWTLEDRTLFKQGETIDMKYDHNFFDFCFLE